MYFYLPDLSKGLNFLDGDEFQHCVKVLRKKEGEMIGLLDGKGQVTKAIITKINKRDLAFELTSTEWKQPKPFRTHIAIAPTKSMDRMEWFVEKAGELGVDEISFISSQNSERPRIKLERLEKKAVSAMKQSKSGYLTKLNGLTPFSKFINEEFTSCQKSIGIVNNEHIYFPQLIEKGKNQIVIIGPEGDFTKQESSSALARNFSPISLGNNVLRTETAGIVVAQMINTINEY